MARPAGKLTGAQLEIMRLLWQRGGRGATVAELWEDLARRREVGRTTVLTLMQRLEKRGWLRRDLEVTPARFHPTCTPQTADAKLAKSFVDEFFGGSAAALVQSLLGANRIKRDELARLRSLLGRQGTDQGEHR